MQQSIAQQLKADASRRSIERLAFMEEQNIRRALGPALWHRLCDEIERECSAADEEIGKTFQVKRQSTLLTVKRLSNARSLRLEYEELGPCISVQESGKRPINVTFRVDSSPSPVLTPMLDGNPMLVTELAMSLILGLSRS